MTSFWEILKSSKSLKASDAFAELWGKSIANSWNIITITGTLPLTFEAKGEALKNYRLYGTETGAGVETENWFDGVLPEYVYNQTRYRQIAVPNGDYTLWTNAPKTKGEKALFFLMGGYQTSGASTANDGVWENSPKTVNTQDGYITIAIHPYTDYDPRDYKITIVPGSTAPTSYIPFGYKIPILNTSGVTENLWDESQRDFSTNTILNDNGEIVAAGGFGYDRNYTPCEPETDYVISGTIVTSSTSMRLYFFDQNKTFISRSDGYGQSSLPKKFTTPANCYYVTFQAYLSAYDPDTIMITKGSTAPSSYIPHRYTADYNLYIGSTKLGAEEYVDYQEQKVYKRTENIYDDAKTQWVNDVLDNNGQSTGGSISSHYTDNFTKVLPNQTYYHNNNFEGTRRYYFYDQNGLWISRTDQIPEWRKRFTTPANCTYIRVQVPVQDASTNWCITADASSSYIPYLQPTDPPAPFPAITAYKGENTLSSEETVGEVSVTGKIKEI